MSHNTRPVAYVYFDTSLKVSECFGEFSPQLVSRFWTYVERREPHECWLWTGGRTGSMGYGQFRVGGEGRGKQVNWYAHRFAFAVSIGVIPEGRSVLHHCDTPLCCNPAHLVLGDHKLNMEHAQQRGRLHVPRPTRHKVTAEQLPEIDALLRAGVKQVRIAEQFGVSKVWISLYAKGLRRQYDRPQAARRTEAA